MKDWALSSKNTVRDAPTLEMWTRRVVEMTSSCAKTTVTDFQSLFPFFVRGFFISGTSDSYKIAWQ
jgi:hypothetical protein